MSTRKPIKTTAKEIVEFWESIIDECELSIDFSDAEERCWRCANKSTLQKCHIIPYSLGGDDTASNLVLLCRRCHIEAPNIKDKEFFWEWLKAHKASLYGTYWPTRGMKEYFEIYNEKIVEAIIRVNATLEEFQQFLNEQDDFYTIHFGEGSLNPSTIAGIMRSFIKHKEQQLGITTHLQ